MLMFFVKFVILPNVETIIYKKLLKNLYPLKFIKHYNYKAE